MRRYIVTALAAAVSATVVQPAGAKTNACRSADDIGWDLHVAQAGCITARSVQRTYFKESGIQPPGRRYFAAGRTWTCRHRILQVHEYDPNSFANRVTGRVLCTHIANRGRFVRWKYQGAGA